MISPAKFLVEATFHEGYRDSKNTGNSAISTSTPSLEARKKKKKKKATTHVLWKYAIQKCLNEEMSKGNFYFPSEQKDVICAEQPVAKSVSILSFHREKLYIIFKKSEMNT